MTHPLGQTLDLPCGERLNNRLVKSAMSDSLGDGEGNPSDAQIQLYERWSQGGMALSLIGEVQVSGEYPEKPGNLVLVPSLSTSRFKTLAKRGQSHSAGLWPQLGHAGALSHGPISQPRGPSPLRLDGLVCDGMGVDQIQRLPAQYARAAALAKTVGFSGVQIHAGHGFLLSQFLSPLFNHRDDRFGGSIEARFEIILQIITAIRRVVGGRFPIGIKLNSSDQIDGGLTQVDALEVIRMLDRTSVDLIEISGGTYFPGAKSSSDSASEGGPYFLEFAKASKTLTNVPIMVTGGFKSQEQAVSAIESEAADVIGLARTWVLDPELAHHWLNDLDTQPVFPQFEQPPPGGITAWYTLRISALAARQEHQFTLSAQEALQQYEARDDARCSRWKRRFSSNELLG